MAAPAVLSYARATLLLCAWLALPAFAATPDEGREPAVDRYRELSLALMVAEGASREWIATLAPDLDSKLPPAPAGTALEPPVRVEALLTPLNRIADQREAVTDAARLFRFALDRRPGIDAELQRIAAEHPAAVAAIEPGHLAEDALLVRSALASGIEYLGRDAPPAWRQGLEAYQQKTVHLRNMMEYWAFDRELAAITEQSLLDTGTRIEAYQRLLEVDPRLDAFTQHLRAVQHIYESYGRKIKPPEDPSEELIRDASKVD